MEVFVDFINLTYDRDKWRNLGYAVMSFRFPQYAESFLSGSRNLDLSRGLGSMALFIYLFT
jgi:hypothetical protein